MIFEGPFAGSISVHSTIRIKESKTGIRFEFYDARSFHYTLQIVCAADIVYRLLSIHEMAGYY
jgi:hypothetical protein